LGRFANASTLLPEVGVKSFLYGLMVAADR